MLSCCFSGVAFGLPSSWVEVCRNPDVASEQPAYSHLATGPAQRTVAEGGHQGGEEGWGDWLMGGLNQSLEAKLPADIHLILGEIMVLLKVVRVPGLTSVSIADSLA